MPKSLVSHGLPKPDIVRVLANLIEKRDAGACFTESTTVVSPDRSAHPVLRDPDIVFLSHAAILDGRLTLTPKVGRDEDFTELSGRRTWWWRFAATVRPAKTPSICWQTCSRWA